jgi:hypothetical protein
VGRACSPALLMCSPEGGMRFAFPPYDFFEP